MQPQQNSDFQSPNSKPLSFDEDIRIKLPSESTQSPAVDHLGAQSIQQMTNPDSTKGGANSAQVALEKVHESLEVSDKEVPVKAETVKAVLLRNNTNFEGSETLPNVTQSRSFGQRVVAQQSTVSLPI